MVDYIDREKVLEDIRTLAEKHHMKEVVRCKDCKWFDGKHIKHNDGHIEYVPEDYPFVENSVGINVQARCMRIPYIDNLFVKDSGMDYCSRAQRISESKYCKGDCSMCEYFAYTGKCALKTGE